MEACWHQNRIKNRCQLRKADFAKSIEKTNEFSLIFMVLGVEVGIKNRSKIEAQDEWPLGIDFWWILVGFGCQLGCQEGPRTGHNDAQVGQVRHYLSGLGRRPKFAASKVESVTGRRPEPEAFRLCIWHLD